MTDIPEILKKLLERRGISADAYGRFFNPQLADLLPPDGLPGVVDAVKVILGALAEKQKIVIFGDYDCDGVCATAILVKTLRALDSSRTDETPVPFLPERLSEGYGMSESSIARMLKEVPDVGLLITVDNGINAIESVAALKAKGVKVVVTDHHLPGDELPAADAIVNPKVAAPKGFLGLCGAGVAFTLANALIAEAKRRGLYAGPQIGGPLLVLAGLATVTDIMPILGHNRVLVSQALKNFRQWAPRGLLELYSRAARTGATSLTSKDFGFLLGPRINAAGRVASGMEALELILAEDKDIAYEAARIVDGHNQERKEVEQAMTEEALAKIVPNAAAQLIDVPNGHPGVAGIVAARVMEKLGSRTPVCVLAGGHGSARAPDGINIRDAFEACKDVLLSYGGHAAAGGFSVKEGEVDRFRQMLCDYCREKYGLGGLAPEDSLDGLKVEQWVEAADLTLDFAEWVAQMEPFGEGNPEPVFGLKGVFFADVRQLGADGRHLSVAFQDRRIPRAVWWNHGDLVEGLRKDSAVTHDVAFKVGVSDYGERHIELRLESIR